MGFYFLKEQCLQNTEFFLSIYSIKLKAGGEVMALDTKERRKNMIKADVLENGLILIYEKIVSDSIKFETVKFSFPESWGNLQKTAVFKNGETTLNVVLNSNNEYCKSEDECFIPFEVIEPPEFTISVFGVADGIRATTARGSVQVTQSGYELGDAPQEPTESEYAQILNIATEAQQIAQSVRDDADNGRINGEKGETGPAGVYYGTEEPTDPTHPVWINPDCEATDEVVKVATETAETVIEEKTSEIKDYVTEQGTYGIWTYRKWNSGIAEAWATTGEKTVKGTEFTQSGNMYISANITEIAPINFFIDAPMVIVQTVGSSDRGSYITSVAMSSTSTIFWSIARGWTDSNDYNLTFNIELKGRWK